MKIATWNVNSLNVRLPHLLQWLASEQIDIIALQETKTVDEKFPHAELTVAGYHTVFSGQKTYNGVAIISRTLPKNIVVGLPTFPDEQKRVLAATVGDIRVINIYVPNGASVDSDKYQYKLTWLQHLKNYLHSELQQHEKLVVLGDFNIAPEDRDVHEPMLWEGCVLVSEPERAAFRGLIKLGLVDSFRLFEQAEKSFSWWDYRQAAFRRNLGLRIDHILVSPALAKQCQQVTIDKVPRGWERPSDHTPVVIALKTV